LAAPSDLKNHTNSSLQRYSKSPLSFDEQAFHIDSSHMPAAEKDWCSRKSGKPNRIAQTMCSMHGRPIQL
jgi:hypothetical protein